MTPFGLVDTGVPLPQSPTLPKLKLRVEDALASPRRLWVRGRILGLDAVRAAPEGHWWNRWWGKGEARATEPPPATLEIQVSGCTFQARVPVGLDGRFEALFPVTLPPARRGWRLARSCLTLDQQKIEGCGIVVAPHPEAKCAVVVLLPLANSYEKTGPQDLARSEMAARVLPVLQQSQQAHPGPLPVYYVAGVTGKEEGREAELALAATALGWPSGSFIIVPGSPDRIVAELALAVDRLRWLFAGSMEMKVVNLEPAATALLNAGVQATADRAAVVDFIRPEANGYGLVGANGPCAGRGPMPQLRPTRATRVTRYPLVFCHGMLAFTTLRMQLPENLNYFLPLREFLSQRGFRALFPQVTPTGGVVTRAGELREQILRWIEEPVNIIAHSMGGLDARYLITHLGLADRVRSLTTVSTPHRGTYVADWFSAHFHTRIPLLLGMQAMGINVDGFRDCQLAACKAFNAITPDMPGVSYFSYGGEATPARLSPVLRRSWIILTPVEGPNDGLVSLASARWGEYLGTIHADHFAQTPDAVMLRPGEDFDSLGFFTRLVEDLARRGF
jgi:triacylglycerol lipase